ncbi:CDGSH iron-sulfur domain-containing protein [Fulvivirga sp. 29W222]|uniref:CDGSH iron-sulfur domain-containing protein n=1 Tax=Fulvivirga marina TaxID=2494733 RepID=A0A937KE42_9BACT|nr:glutamate synthase-related protein [Fulvivirga marina]MBL6446720.1 CDGSH iron-sulfur domain-containing protein [Fulvivirga marina]
MSKPKIADKKPKKVELKKGEEQYWCACGRSNNQPYCDGAHRTTDITPVKFTAEESGDAYLCMCKHTHTPPYCDGTHAKLKEEDNSTNPAPSGNGSTREEPTLAYIKALARDGLTKTGHHGEMGAMGVPIPDLPQWKDIQVLAAQLATKPLMEDIPVGTELIIGPNAKKPLKLDIPLFVSDMSFGALSEEAKISLSKGAELAGTGICSGEGGMLEEEQQANSKYFYELASAKFGFDWDKLKRVQAFHFKGGQGAKTGTGGHLSGNKVTEKIAAVRNLKVGTAAISPPTFADLHTVEDFKNFADQVREITGGIPIGFKLSANHIEEDIQFALDASADYIILDGRGGGTGAAPLIFRNNISVPTIPALARARHYLNKVGREDVTLIITGGVRVPDDFIKALALGADGIALSNAALQSIGCIAARMCNTNNCPSGVATQKPELRKLINIDKSANQLYNFFIASTELMKVMARACGHNHLNQFNQKDITTWKKDMAELTGIKFAGLGG